MIIVNKPKFNSAQLSASDSASAGWSLNIEEIEVIDALWPLDAQWLMYSRIFSSHFMLCEQS